MKRHFEIDYPRLVRLLLPPFLRRPLITAMLEAATAGVSHLYGLFTANRKRNIYDLSITPQVCYLKKALNDGFDNDLRRIYITDGIIIPKTYLFTKAEAVDLYLFTKAEKKPVGLYAKADYEDIDPDADFIVRAPAAVTFDKKEMEALLDLYKLAGKSYSIYFF